MMAWESNLNPGLFKSSQAVFQQQSRLEVIPTKWSFYITILIALFMLAFHIYGISIYCFKNDSITNNQSIIAREVYCFFILASFFHVVWLFAQDEKRFWWSTGFSLLMTALLAICFSLGLSKLKEYKNQNKYRNNNKLRKHIIFNIAIVYNGFGLYMTWTYWMFVLNIGTAMACHRHDNIQSISEMCAAILTFGFLVYFIHDLGFLKKGSKFVITPYLMLIWISGTMIANEHSKMLAFKISILVIGIIFSLWKGICIFISIIKHESNNTIHDYSLYSYLPKKQHKYKYIEVSD